MIVKLQAEQHLEFLSLKGGCRGSSESTLVKMSNCWKFHAPAQFNGNTVVVYVISRGQREWSVVISGRVEGSLPLIYNLLFWNSLFWVHL